MAMAALTSAGATTTAPGDDMAMTALAAVSALGPTFQAGRAVTCASLPDDQSGVPVRTTSATTAAGTSAAAARGTRRQRNAATANAPTSGPTGTSHIRRHSTGPAPLTWLTSARTPGMS